MMFGCGYDRPRPLPDGGHASNIQSQHSSSHGMAGWWNMNIIWWHRRTNLNVWTWHQMVRYLKWTLQFNSFPMCPIHPAWFAGRHFNAEIGGIFFSSFQLSVFMIIDMVLRFLYCPHCVRPVEFVVQIAVGNWLKVTQPISECGLASRADFDVRTIMSVEYWKLGGCHD